MNKLWFILLSSVLFCFAAGPATAQVVNALQVDATAAAADESEVPTVRLLVSPQAEPVPALRYRLLPPYEDLQPGNAVPFYYRAMLNLRGLPPEINQKYADNYEKWLTWPLDESLKPEIVSWLDAHQTALAELEKAVYREDCDWDYRLRELRGPSVINFQLADAQQARTLARALQIKARLAISEGRVDEALETLRTGYRLAVDVSQPRILISSLVGIAVASMMHGELEHLLSVADTPNLYWALATMPQPLISTHDALEHERVLAEQLLPILKDAEDVEYSPEEWQRKLSEMLSNLQGAMGPEREIGVAERMAITGWIMLKYPGAKQALLEAGYEAARVEAMPVAQVIAVHTARMHRILRDELFKWSYVPYGQAYERLNEFEQTLGERSRSEPIPISALLLPAVRASLTAELRLQRHTALLRTVEAIRMQAAANQGRLPDSLDAVSVVPVPVDPFSQRPFSYRLDGATAVLEMDTLPGQPKRGEARRYVLELRTP